MRNLRHDRPIAFVDLETTGRNPSLDRIVEFSVLRIQPDGSQEFKSARVNPGVAIPAGATSIHGITDEDVADKPRFSEYAPDLQAFLVGCDIGGFAVRRFDLPMLEAEFERVRAEFSRKGRRILDAQAIYHRLEPRDLTAAYRKYCGKELQDAHSSEADVRAALEVLECQLEVYPDLPRDVAGLHEFCNPEEANWVDVEGRFVWSDGQAVFDFGQYRGKALREVASGDPGYLQWIAGANFPREVQEIAARALKGEFPESPQGTQSPKGVAQGTLRLFEESS